MTEMDNRIEKEQSTPYEVIDALIAIFYIYIYFFFERKKGINFVTT